MSSSIKDAQDAQDMDILKKLSATTLDSPSDQERSRMGTGKGNWKTATEGTVVIVTVGGATIFHKFPLLPLELKGKIWGFAAPPPVVIIRRKSQKEGRRFRFFRPNIPAVLHACRESRAEYLDTEDPNDETLERRRKEHPVYKLSFGDGTENGCKAFYSEQDSFWAAISTRPNGQNQDLVNTTPNVSWRENTPAELKHLVISAADRSFFPSRHHFRRVFRYYSSIETITYLMSNRYLRKYGAQYAVNLPEVNGEANISEYIVWDYSEHVMYEFRVAKESARKRGVLFPDCVKIRLEQQFVKIEKVVLHPKTVAARPVLKAVPVVEATPVVKTEISESLGNVSLALEAGQ